MRHHVHAATIALAIMLSLAVSSLWAAPVAEVYDPQLDWTTVPTGMTTYVATFIDNIGEEDLLLSNAVIAGPDATDFSVMEMPGTVSPRKEDYPGSGRRILIGFKPSSPGLKTAVLSFSTNDPLLSQCTIDLSGTGITPPTAQGMATATWAYRYKTQHSLSVRDLVTQVHETPDRGMFLVGVEDQCSSQDCKDYTYRHAVVSRIGPEGSALWLKRYTGPRGSGEILASDKTSDGGLVMLLHECLAEPAERDVLLVKLEGTGAVEWAKRLGTSKSIWAYALKQSSDGGFVIGGAIGDLQCDVDCGSRALLIKTDASGKILVQKSFRDVSVFTDISEGPGGAYLASGPSERSLALMKLNKDFKRIWQKSFGDVAAWSASPETLLIWNPDGAYIVVHRNAILGFDVNDSLSYYGATDACVTYASAFARDKSGGYLIGCAGGIGGRLIKLGEDGNVEWGREYLSYPAGIISLEKEFYHVGFQYDGFAAARLGPKGRIDNARYPNFSTELPGVSLAQTFDPTSTAADFPFQDEDLTATDGSATELPETQPVTVLAGLTVLPTYPVTVTRLDSGTGSITSVPAGIECGSICSDVFAVGTSVMLFAVPAPGLAIQWGGACSGSSTSCRLPDIMGARNVTVAFKKTYPLTISNAGRGSGKIAGRAMGERMDCTLSGGQNCSYQVIENGSVLLEASPDEGMTFLGWSGACAGMSTCAITMTETKNVQARFEPGVPFFVTKTGSGSGTVSSQPAGIDCGPTCSNGFIAGSTIALSVTASPGSVFAGWSGACSGNGACTVVAGSDTLVTAQFDLLPPTTGKRLTVVKRGSGHGKVISLRPRDAIDCGSVCAAELTEGTRVMLHVQHEPDSRFVGWAGACSGQSTCKLRMDRDRTAIAIFEKKKPRH
jgi:hypothetical protein